MAPLLRIPSSWGSLSLRTCHSAEERCFWGLFCLPTRQHFPRQIWHPHSVWAPHRYGLGLPDQTGSQGGVEPGHQTQSSRARNASPPWSFPRELDQLPPVEPTCLWMKCPHCVLAPSFPGLSFQAPLWPPGPPALQWEPTPVRSVFSGMGAGRVP